MIKPMGLVICLLIPGTLPQMQAPVCYQPTVKCPSSYSFAPYQLPFVIKEKLVFGKSYQSEEFYAVILKSVKAVGDPDCTIVTEEERLETQKLWPTRKVFASHLNCPEELVLYDNVDRNFNFLAVYAGKTLKEAQRVLTQIKANPRYSQVYLKRMRVIVEYST
jgi:hypothetical protein